MTSGADGQSVPPGMRVNMYGDLEPIILDNTDWNKRWEKNNISFHSTDVQENLIRHIDTLTQGRSNIKILLPLCGKTVDMVWLSDQGHTVVGVECSELAIKEFSSENKLQFEVEPIPGNLGSLYKSTDKKIRIYQMDLFEFNKELEGVFDGIWDKNSFLAVNLSDRKKYVDTLLSVMSPDCVHLLDTVSFDPEKFLGPPHNVTRGDLDRLFGDRCLVKEVETSDNFCDLYRSRGLDWHTQTLYQIQPKTV